MRIPDPKANTTTEAYLAYKAGYLEESELKPKLYKPDWHFDGWLAYWAGLVNTYPTKENGDPDMLCDEEALVAYLSGVTDTYPEEIKDPYDVRIVGYLKYLVSARWGRPEYPVNNEEFYLSTMKPPVVPSGDTPSSDIEMDDTAEAPFIDLKMYGDTYQQTYSGKNLFNIQDATGTRGNNTVVASNQTITVNSNTSGTETAFYLNDCSYISQWAPGQWENARDFNMTGMGGDYTFKVYYNNVPTHTGSTTTLNLYFYTNKRYILKSRNDIVDNTITFSVNLDSDEYIKSVLLYVAAGNIFNNFTIKTQLESGSTATSYEPYVGGIPAPNPDYPQEVQTVTGEQTVKVSGKNLWGGLPTDIRTSERGISWVNKADGTIVANGTATAVSSSLFSSIAVSNNHTITLQSGTYILSGGINDAIRLELIKSDGTLLGISTATPKTITLSAQTTVFVRGSITGGTTVSDVELKPMLEQGSTATDYQPYQSQSYEINLGKNLFDKSNPNVIVGTVETNGYNASGSNKSFYLECESNTTYTIQKRNDGDTNRFIVATANTIPVQGTAMSGLTQKNNDSSVTITTGNDAKYIVCTFYRITETTLTEQQLIDSIQVEVGSTATSYAPYFEPIELCKIGDYQDYIYRDEDGDWYLHKDITKAVLDGTESWAVHNIYNGIYGFRVDAGAAHSNSAVLASSYRAVLISEYNSNNRSYGTISSLESTTTSIYYRLFLTQPNSTISNLSSFTTWLGSHNITTYYASQTPTDTQITNSELIAQLDTLMEGGSYEGKTYIKVTATDPNLPGLLYVEAGKYD